MTKQELETKLQDCKALMEQGLISQQDFDREKQSLLDQWRGQGIRPAAVTKTLMDLQVNMEVGPANARFILTKELGRGGMASVWKAKDIAESERRGHECYKALKFLHPDFSHSSAHHKRLQREADNAKQLRHPNIVGVYGFEQGNDQQLFLIMDYLQGRDLSEVLEDEGKGQGLSWDRIKTLMTPVAEALHYAHQEHKLIHRDIKPANLFLTDQGQIKILDFGLSEQIQQSGLQLGMKTDNRSGTKVYWAPEVCVGSQLATSRDVYAFSAVIYELLTGQPPFAEAIVCERTATLKAKQPAGLNDQAWEVLCRGLAYDVDKRPKNIRDYWKTLLQVEDVTLAKKNAHIVYGHRAALQAKQPAGLNDYNFYINILLFTIFLTLIFIFLYYGFIYKQVVHYPDNMVEIPAGEFYMGCISGRGCEDNELPVHLIKIKKPFEISAFEISNEEYVTFLNDLSNINPVKNRWFKVKKENQSSRIVFDNKKYTIEKGYEKHPVVNVSWYGAQAYAKWLSQKTGKTFRLPTEAEWEYAARAGTTSSYATGNCINTDEANYDGKSAWVDCPSTDVYLGTTVRVDSKFANQFGLYHMHGNVGEWVGDCYSSYEKGNFEEIDKCNSEDYIVRGGSWLSDIKSLRSSKRHYLHASVMRSTVGFRIVRDL